MQGQVIPDNMMTGGQTRKEANRLRAGVLNPKHNIRFGNWNVRTMFETSKPAQVIKEMDRYNISILGIAEAQWTGHGLQKTDTGHTILYSGNQHHHIHGVAIIINKEASKALIEWEPISDRMIRARFDSKYCKATFFQVYAPTNDKDDEVKEEFYSLLSSELHKIPKHDLLMVNGDFNAKVGKDRRGYEDALGTEGIGDRNDNGNRLLECCINNELVVMGTQFQHKDIHKLTWKSPDGRTRNMIDHSLVNRKWIKSVRDTRVFRDADVGSDHNLVICTVKLCLKAAKKQEKSHKKSLQYRQTEGQADKSPGGDQISAELLLADLDTAVKVLTDLLGKIWRKEKLPDDWVKGIIIKLPKKGDLAICDNWRGIMLLSIPSKVLPIFV